MVKNPLASEGDLRDMGSIPGSGRSPEGGHGNPLQYSCLENPMDSRDWQATYTPWGRKEWDTTEQLTHTYTRSWHPVPSLHGKMKGKK